MKTLDVVIVNGVAIKGTELDDKLTSLGYRSRFVTPDIWLREAGCCHFNPTIFAMEPVPKQCDQILSNLRCIAVGPILGLFPCCSGKWDDASLTIFDDFIIWPCDLTELGLRLDRLSSSHKIISEIVAHSDPYAAFRPLNLIGRAPAFIAALELIRSVSQCDAPVLISGETGTGKELCARAIHSLGLRRDSPFIPVNCGSIPDDLLENELFGHDRGAYTDAKCSQPGMVELANGGTLFLDEVDSLSDKAQVTLLRFTQNQEYRPLGGGCTKQANVRIVVATNTDLTELVKSGDFREDLLYRLNVLPIRMPPLRERVEDVELIAQHILKRYSDRYEQPEKRLHPDTLAWMQRYSWPGNVRELENIMQRGLLLSAGPFIRLNSLNDKYCIHEHSSDYSVKAAFDGMQFNEAKALVIKDFEVSYLQWLMAESNGNVSEAARRAGKERRALGKLIKKHHIDKRKFS